MALNLRRRIPSVDQLVVYDTNIEVSEKLVQSSHEMVTVATDLVPIAQTADTIITCLLTPNIAERSFKTLIHQAVGHQKHRLIIDCSTIDPATSKNIAGQSLKAGFGVFVDAPMSGGVTGAQAGTLSFMVGSTIETFQQVLPILEMMGKNIVHCGVQGSGLSAKLVNNYLLAINNLATAEAMNFGIQAGLDPFVLAGIINSATGQNWASMANNPVPGVVKTAPASRGYEGGFATRLMHKDLNLAVAAAEPLQASLPLSKAAAEIYGKMAEDSEYGGKDFSIVYKFLQGCSKARL